ncbi:hypothetical protein DAPPUDRAFT_313924 [Daphnia pulex]|uniref:Uncharacterized protein n=1 Tax=Daphnia pulex TaxID=6669 RepID=E9G5P5_DAPPU|nr:hypothetical protein DAPPUDRAFT_313924 [Daphnia pulex]|eukprot:EFX85242.1 hypothetical protein DAPPUDRAFT_313924 [Daphnia pulex]
MHLSTYLLLVGAAVLVTQFSGTDAYAIKSKQVEDHDSTETSADNEHVDAALNRTSSSEDSAQEEEEEGVEDSSEEKANKQVEKRSAQFSRNSDEFDNFSFENDNRRRPANVRNPVFRNSDERIDASDELRSVLASRLRPNVPTRTAFANSDRLPLVPLSFRNLARQQQQPDDDFDDDISIEIRNRVAVTQPPVIQSQRVVATSTATAGRLPAAAPTGLRNPILVRQQSDDDFDDVSLEIVRQVAPTPVRQVVATTQTALPNRLPVPMGFRTQLVRESDGDLSLEVVRVTPNQPTVPSPNNNQVAANSNIRTAAFSQSDERDDVSVELFGSLLNRNAGQLLQTAPPAAQQTSAIRPIQQANNRQQPIQTFNQVNNVSARPVTARPQVQPPVTTATQPAVASSSNRLPLVPMGFRNTILVRQSDDFDDDISLEIIRDRVAPATSVVQQVVATQTATSDRLPIPMSFRNPILRQSDEFDDVSIEIRDRNVFTAPQQVNRPAANSPAAAPVNANRPEFVVTQDADGDVSLELVSRVQSQQPTAGVENQSAQQQGFSISPVRPLVPPRPVLAAGISLVPTGNEGQRVNVFDDYSLEDNDDDNDDFFLEDQFDNVDGFRLLASDFFAQSPGNGFPVERSVENQRETAQKDMQDRGEEDNLAEPVSLDDSDFHVPSEESDDWFLVKQYMDHDYSSEELEGELAKEYFWQPVKDDASKKVKTDQDKMDELKPARS